MNLSLKNDLNHRYLTFRRYLCVKLALMKLFTATYSVIHNKCPRCHKGDVFVKKNPYNLKNMFHMHKKCAHCELMYEKEPGFFYGAMYASYGLMVGWFVLWWFIQSIFLDLDSLGFVIGFCTSIIVMSPLSLRWSRLIWLNLFYAYDKKLSK
jgi:hypothetical protein